MKTMVDLEEVVLVIEDFQRRAKESLRRCESIAEWHKEHGDKKLCERYNEYAARELSTYVTLISVIGNIVNLNQSEVD